jgi:hypothetical protein
MARKPRKKDSTYTPAVQQAVTDRLRERLAGVLKHLRNPASWKGRAVMLATLRRALYQHHPLENLRAPDACGGLDLEGAWQIFNLGVYPLIREITSEPGGVNPEGEGYQGATIMRPYDPSREITSIETELSPEEQEEEQEHLRTLHALFDGPHITSTSADYGPPDENGIQHPIRQKITSWRSFVNDTATLTAQLFSKMKTTPPGTVPEAVELIKRETDELVDRTAFVLHMMADGKVEDTPAGFYRATLTRAASEFPWATNCDAGRLLNLLLALADVLPPGERSATVFPGDVAPKAVFDWYEGHKLFGKLENLPSTLSRVVQVIGTIPTMDHPPVGPEPYPEARGYFTPLAFASLYLAHQETERWHRPHNDRHDGHTDKAKERLAILKGKQDPGALRMLADTLFEHERAIRSEVGWPELERTHQADEQGEMLKADALLADALATIGTTGKKHADKVREASRKRWGEQAELFKQWESKAGKPPGFIDLLVDALWPDVVEPRLKREQNLIAPALTRTVFDASMRGIHGKGRTLGDTLELFSGADKVAMVDPERFARLSRIIPTLNRQLLERKIAALASEPSHRFLRWIVHRGFENIKTGTQDPRRVYVTGGLDALRQLLKLKSHKHRGTLRDILDALQVVQLPIFGGGHVSLLMWDEIKATKNRQAEIRITLGDPLMPGFTHALTGRGRSKDEAARLVPVPSNELLPPGVGRPNDRAAQAALQMLVMREFSDQSIELVEQGAVHIPGKKWDRLADEAELPKKLVGDVLESWQQKGGASQGWMFPVIEQVEPERFKLGKAYKQETEFLEQQGKLRQSARKAGKRSKENRRKGKRGKKS